MLLQTLPPSIGRLLRQQGQEMRPNVTKQTRRRPPPADMAELFRPPMSRKADPRRFPVNLAEYARMGDTSEPAIRRFQGRKVAAQRRALAPPAMSRDAASVPGPARTGAPGKVKNLEDYLMTLGGLGR